MSLVFINGRGTAIKSVTILRKVALTNTLSVRLLQAIPKIELIFWHIYNYKLIKSIATYI